MKFKRSYSNARNLGSAYKFAFGGDINRAKEICLGPLGVSYKLNGLNIIDVEDYLSPKFAVTSHFARCL